MSDADSVGRRFLAGPPDDPARYWVDEPDLANVEIGGEGLVYRARCTSTGEVVALKMLTAIRADQLAQFIDRAQLLETVRHPNLMEQVEVFTGRALAEADDEQSGDADVTYSVANWVDGEPLTVAVETATVPTKLRWITDIAAALDHLHNQRSADAPHGIVHRDVKPSNVRINTNGKAVLVDFGIARPVDHTDMTEGIGTYLWRAPEVLAGAPTGVETDAWALGALAHWLLIGEPPQLDGAAAAEDRIAHTGGLGDPRAVGHHVAQLLHSSPANRPTNLGRWSSTLLRIGHRRRDRRRVVRLAGAGVAVFLIAGSAVAVNKALQPPSDPEWLRTRRANIETGSVECLTFANPIGRVLRENIDTKQNSGSDWTFTLGEPGHRELSIGVSRNGWELPLEMLGSDGESRTIQSSHGVAREVKVWSRLGSMVYFWFTEGPDNWGVAVTSDSPLELTRGQLDRAGTNFIRSVRLEAREPVPSPQYTAIPNLATRTPEWALTIPGTVTKVLRGYADRSIDPHDLPGRATTVLGQPAIVGQASITWRETPDVIVVLGENIPEHIGNVERYVAQRRSSAEALRPCTRVAYDRFPPDLDPNADFILKADPSVVGLTIRSVEDGFGQDPNRPTADARGTMGALGLALSRQDERATGVFVWATQQNPLSLPPTSKPPCAEYFPYKRNTEQSPVYKFQNRCDP